MSGAITVARPKRRLTIALASTYLLLLVAVVLFKLPFYSETLASARVVNLIPLAGSFDDSGALNLYEIAANTLVFVPLGIYLCALTDWTFARKVASIAGVSLAFEVIQFVFALGRADITDLLDNTFGGVIGVGIYALLRALFKESTVKGLNMLASTATIFALLCFMRLFYLSHFVMLRGHL